MDDEREIILDDEGFRLLRDLGFRCRVNGFSRGPGSVYHTTRIKTYEHSGTWEALTASRPIFKEPGWEDRYQRVQGRKSAPDASEGEKPAGEPSYESVMRAVRRAKVAVRDYALSTDFRYFVTLTLDASRVDRYDIVEITRKMQAWCSNQVQRRGLAYILVPELHKDGAVHFHGFFNDALPVEDSGTMVPPEGGKPKCPRSLRQRSEWAENGGRVVYNLPAWTLGYTTAIELYGDYRSAVGYVCKYIGKAQGADADGPPQKIGGRWYYSGGKLGKPVVTYADDSAREALERGGHAWDVPEAFVTLVREAGNL